jgi:hypothetical protein
MIVKTEHASRLQGDPAQSQRPAFDIRELASQRHAPKHLLALADVFFRDCALAGGVAAQKHEDQDSGDRRDTRIPHFDASLLFGDYDRIVVRFLASLSAAVAIAASAPLSAHHWFNASYDSSRTVTLTGIVTRFEWKNPHALFYIDVPDGRGGVATRWLMEMGSPNSLARAGWSRSSLRVGETVTVEGIPARKGVPMGYPMAVVTETGRRLIAASPPAR